MSDVKPRTNYERVCVDGTASWCKQGHCTGLAVPALDDDCESCAAYWTDQRAKEAAAPAIDPETQANEEACALGEAIKDREALVLGWSVMTLIGVMVPNPKATGADHSALGIDFSRRRRALILWLEE
jgi:hypothetical protein